MEFQTDSKPKLKDGCLYIMKSKKWIFRITSSALFLLLSACIPSVKKDNRDQESRKTQAFSIDQYRSKLAAFSFDSPASSLKALELFKHTEKSNTDSNDLALKSFLDFQDELADSLNQRLTADTAFYSRLNSLAFPDSALYETEDLEFERKLQSYGFQLRRAEGSVYFVNNPDLTKEYFYEYLTKAGKAFLLQYAEEINQPFAADATLMVSVEELGKRTVFWDKFTVSYPDSPFFEYGRKRFKQYLYFLLAGIDNTPAFRDGKLSNTFLTAYEAVIKEFPSSKTAEILKEYKSLLAENNYFRSPVVREFLEEHSYL